jgi:hypothetical protein
MAALNVNTENTTPFKKMCSDITDVNAVGKRGITPLFFGLKKPQWVC